MPGMGCSGWPGWWLRSQKARAVVFCWASGDAFRLKPELQPARSVGVPASAGSRKIPASAASILRAAAGLSSDRRWRSSTIKSNVSRLGIGSAQASALPVSSASTR